MGKKNWTDLLRNEEVLRRIKKERNILHAINGRKVTGIGHILVFHRNCLLKCVFERRCKGQEEKEEGLTLWPWNWTFE
jgi:hypothetical protein